MGASYTHNPDTSGAEEEGAADAVQAASVSREGGQALVSTTVGPGHPSGDCAPFPPQPVVTSPRPAQVTGQRWHQWDGRNATQARSTSNVYVLTLALGIPNHGLGLPPPDIHPPRTSPPTIIFIHTFCMNDIK